MANTSDYMPCALHVASELTGTDYDGAVQVWWRDAPVPRAFEDALRSALQRDAGLDSETAVLAAGPGLLVHAPTGPIDPDYSDVRVFREAAAKGMRRALKAGLRRPLLVLLAHPSYKHAELATLLGALEALYVPLDIRESNLEKRCKVSCVGVWTQEPSRTGQLVDLARVLESGLSVARDIGGGDPERMAPPRVQQYVRKLFSGSAVKVSVVEDLSQISQNYPLFEAVNRAASVVERHRGCILFLEYEPEQPATVTDTLYLVGKGVTYDTGGADIKAGGVMAGMSRDKCGAAAVAGFLQVVKELQPADVKVVGALSMVRNSVGSNCYVSDEVITARSGARVRVGNTDAEGRMVMADVLCQMKEHAVDAINPHLYTIATLTGHACLAAGDYSIVLDNGPARRVGHAGRLQECGEEIGDAFEVSTLRRDDIEFHRGKAQGDDILQCNNLPSSRTPRGHQGPAAFLLLASGLDQFGSGSTKPLKYSHLDIAGSAGNLPDDPTGSSILALCNLYLLK